MSYLDVPRLHFSGRFKALPSTINNDVANYGIQNDICVYWNPYGDHNWYFEDCTFTSAIVQDGTIYNRGNPAPIIGAPLITYSDPVPAKLVDLDPQQQSVSQIWGMRLKIGAGADAQLLGSIPTATLYDLWIRCKNGKTGDAEGAGYYCTQLVDLEWGTITSPVLQTLYDLSPDALAVQFAVDGFNAEITSPGFGYGRVYGTIGPVWEGEPPNFAVARLMRPPTADLWKPPPMFYGIARLDEVNSRLYVDLSNALATQTPGGETFDYNDLYIGVRSGSYGTPMLSLGDYSATTLQTYGGIWQFDGLTSNQIERFKSYPIAIVQVKADHSTAVLISENDSGTYINATEYVHRLDPGDQMETTLWAMQRGELVGGQAIEFSYNAKLMTENPNNMQLRECPDLCTPADALPLPPQIITGSDGTATLTLTASNPGTPRGYVDGQLYAIQYRWAGETNVIWPDDPEGFISVLLHSAYPGEPTWQYVQPILTQYARLYPFMVNLSNLGDHLTISRYLNDFLTVMAYDITDPRYMPITRDMSRDKRNLFVQWLRDGAPVPEEARRSIDFDVNDGEATE